jgi:hypothetical protein
MKAFAYFLFRNLVTFAVLYAWLFKHIDGAGNIFAVYVAAMSVLMVILACVPVKPEDAIKAGTIPKFWRWIDALLEWVIFFVLVWMGHFGVSTGWAVLQFALAVARGKYATARRDAQKLGIC